MKLEIYQQINRKIEKKKENKNPPVFSIKISQNVRLMNFLNFKFYDFKKCIAQ
jgi:hypothetical protein